MDFLELAQSRRSIRWFTEQEVSEEHVTRILEAIRWTPSGGNIQPWEVIVVRDPSTRRKLQETMEDSNPAKKSFMTAPVVLVLCGKVGIPDIHRGKCETKFGTWWFMFHLGSAAQNLCLAAHCLRLGTVMIGFFDHDRARKVLNVPEGYEVVLLVPLGHAAKTPLPPRRRPAGDFTHYERF